MQMERQYLTNKMPLVFVCGLNKPHETKVMSGDLVTIKDSKQEFSVKVVEVSGDDVFGTLDQDGVDVEVQFKLENIFGVTR